MSEARNTTLRRIIAVFALSCAALLVSPLALGEEIKIGGTGNALGTIRLLGDAFTRKYPGMKVTVMASLGSSGALKAVPKGAIDIGVSSRELSDDERASGAVSSEYARSPTVFAVGRKTKVTSISRQQIAGVYSGEFAEWPDKTPVRPVLRQPGDDNTRQIRSLSLEIGKALDAAERREGMARAVTDQEAADKIESTPGAIGVSTLALMRSEARPLSALAIDGVEPTPANGASGAYPLVKRFYFITQPTRSVPVQQFIGFVASPDGRAILAQTGHWLP